MVPRLLSVRAMDWHLIYPWPFPRGCKMATATPNTTELHLEEKEQLPGTCVFFLHAFFSSESNSSSEHPLFRLLSPTWSQVGLLQIATEHLDKTGIYYKENICDLSVKDLNKTVILLQKARKQGNGIEESKLCYTHLIYPPSLCFFI